jgi:hypothetical protein
VSHFTVLVIGDDHEEQLAPYHEYECTGFDDEYVVDQDETAKYEQEYEEGTETMLRLVDGTLVEPYQDCFKEEKEHIFEPNVWNYPEGSEKVEVPFTERYENFHAFMTKYQEWDEGDHEYAYIIRDSNKKYGYRCVRRTNPNAKWDWYQVGGRWTGFYKLKEGSNGELGDPGLMTEKAEEGKADILTKGDIDIEGMLNEAAEAAHKEYDKFEEVTKNLMIPPTWEYIRETMFDNIEEAREYVKNDAWFQALREARIEPFMQCTHDYFCVEEGGRERFVYRARQNALTPFAFVKDKVWVEKGEMGYWGMTSNEKEQYDWNDEFMEMFEELPDDTQLTLVDCHI